MAEYNQWCVDTYRSGRCFTGELRFKTFCKTIKSDPALGISLEGLVELYCKSDQQSRGSSALASASAGPAVVCLSPSPSLAPLLGVRLCACSVSLCLSVSLSLSLSLTSPPPPYPPSHSLLCRKSHQLLPPLSHTNPPTPLP